MIENKCKKINVIFLDIDGVLNTPRFQMIQIKNFECDAYESQFNFDPICMRNLKELIDKTDAYIVVSSTWRFDPDPRYMNEIVNNLKLYGIVDRIIGVTPDLSEKYNSMLIRGHEIKQWIKENKNTFNIDKFVIIDDDNDMFDLIDHLAECDYEDGFINEVKEIALKIMEVK